MCKEHAPKLISKKSRQHSMMQSPRVESNGKDFISQTKWHMEKI